MNMGKAELVTSEASVEWLNWDQAVMVVRTLKVGPKPWAVLADFCGQGLVETKAATLICNGEVRRDENLEPALWRMCQAQGIYLDPLDGSIRLRHRDPETKEPTTITITGIEFRKDQVLALASRVDGEDVAAALAVKGSWLDRGAPADDPKLVTSAGRKPQRERWQAFYFAVIELAKDGRLTADHFNSAAALNEEILLLMGDGAFSPDHTKAVAGQIYKRFCGG
jgi:hypothetical protein